MLINASNLQVLFTGFNAAFNEGFSGAQSQWSRIAMRAPSITAVEQYGWLAQLPKMREWLGGRHVKNLALHDYTIKNRDFEMTVSVERNKVEDDQYGVLAPAFSEMGRAAAETPDELCFSLLAAGFEGQGYDKQPFFDTDHPVKLADGTEGTVSNMQAGSAEPWYLLDTSRAVRPIIYQERRPFNNLVKLDRETDENVFFDKEYIYGVEGRANAGYGLWQLAFGSKAELNATNYAAARAAMMALRGDEGRPLGVRPTLMVVPPELEEDALYLLNTENKDAGASNPWKGTVELIVTPWANTSGIAI